MGTWLSSTRSYFWASFFGAGASRPFNLCRCAILVEPLLASEGKQSAPCPFRPNTYIDNEDPNASAA
jgi:hypothetical protein